MKLDPKAMRHLTLEDWRVLTAVEQGSKNHELVPMPLIEKLSRLCGGASRVHKSISALAQIGLIARVREAKYDGYRLTYGGLDYLALHAYAKRNVVYSVGDRIGVGKESDIMVVVDDKGTKRVLKIHRLGRISFRTVKSNRDYLRKNQFAASWMYLSRLAAQKEFAFMKALSEEGFPVPEPISQSRHTIVMSLINAQPMRHISHVPDPAGLYAELIALILRLASHGLIHGDFNEFNILIKEEEGEEEKLHSDRLKGQHKPSLVQTIPDPLRSPRHSQARPDTQESRRSGQVTCTPILIDFPQMVSMDHPNAEMYFDRDVDCVKRFFLRRFHFTSYSSGPTFTEARNLFLAGQQQRQKRRLDAAAQASGFTKKMAQDLEAVIKKEQEGKAEKRDDGDGQDQDEDDGLLEEEVEDEIYEE